MDNNLSTSPVKSASDYNLGGITHIWLLDITGFSSYKFTTDNSSKYSIVESIVASLPFVELGAVNESQFTEDCSENIFRQKLITFVCSPDTVKLNKLLTVSHNKNLVVFRSFQGHFFTFGSDGGASISFSQQTGQVGESSGYTISITKNSIYPLFEIKDNWKRIIPYMYRPVFSGNICCQLQNGKQTGYQIATFVVKETKDGKGVDITGRSCLESGRKQAIQILEGVQNPYPDVYEIESEYGYDVKDIMGISIIKRNTAQCIPYFPKSIQVDKPQVVFYEEDNNIVLTLTSLHKWALITSSGIANCLPANGSAGKNKIVLSKTNMQGITNFKLQNQLTRETVLVNVVNKNNIEWVLKNGTWNADGIWLVSEAWF